MPSQPTSLTVTLCCLLVGLVLVPVLVDFWHPSLATTFSLPACSLGNPTPAIVGSHSLHQAIIPRPCHRPSRPSGLPSDTHLSPWSRLNALASLPSTAFTCQTPRSGNTLLTCSGLHPSTKSPNVARLKIRSRLAGLNFMNSELEWILSGAWQHCLISPVNSLPYYSRGSLTLSLSKPAPTRIQTSHSSARPTLFLSQDICT